MNDPHVTTLHYALETKLTFSDPPPIHHSEQGFDLDLESGKLTMTMLDHYTTIDAARKSVEPYLRAWEISAALARQLRGRELRFAFVRGEVIDRQPSSGNTVTLTGVDTGSASDSAEITVTIPTYPSPPTNFVFDADTRTLWERYESYLLGREPLLSMAYFCLSVIDFRAGGGRKGWPTSSYKIDQQIRDYLGDLVSEYGDEATARKLDKKVGGFQPLQPEQEEWIRAVIRRLIGRVGEVAYNPSHPWPMITMADFTQI